MQKELPEVNLMEKGPRVRTVYLSGEITHETLESCIREIQLIQAEKKSTKPIKLFINTPGGCPYSSLALYDFISTCKTPIHTYAMGMCMSGGTLVWLAGKKKYTYLNTTFMFHTIAGGVSDGKLYESKVDIKESERVFDLMCEIYDHHSLHDLEWWKQRLQYKDVYIPASQIGDLGIDYTIVQ